MQVVVALAFVVVFGGVGGYFLSVSHAAPSGCVTRTFTNAYVDTYEPCVVDAQGMMVSVRNRIGGLGDIPLGTAAQRKFEDGYYGPKTADTVADFQGTFMRGVKNWNYQILGPATWRVLCSQAFSQGDDYVNAGCKTEPK